MITYLKDGWYTRLGQRRLRNEVVDGAIDTASMLFRSGVPPEAITSLALKIRTLATLVDPPHRRRSGGFGQAEQTVLVQRLQMYTDRYPALQSFISDCLEHVTNAIELRALYLHLIHVSQMMQLLMVAKLSGATAGLGLFQSPSASPTPGAGAAKAALSSDDATPSATDAPTPAKRGAGAAKKKKAASKSRPLRKTARKPTSKKPAKRKSSRK